MNPSEELLESAAEEQVAAQSSDSSELPTPAVSEVPVEPSPIDPSTDWAARIRAEQRLPGAIRERLAAAVEASATSELGQAEPRLALSQVASIFAAAVPTLLRSPATTEVAAHPQGEAFFSGGPLSTEDAARIAREQLARTGFGRS